MLIDLTIIGLPGYTLDPETTEIFGKTGRRLNQRIDKFGYRCVYVELPGVSKNQRVHKIIAKTCVPNPNNYNIVQHKDNDKLNNYPSNLVWGTYKSNNQQCYDENRNPGNTKKEAELKIIKEAIKQGGTYSDIISYCHARDVGISKGSVTKYKRMFS